MNLFGQAITERISSEASGGAYYVIEESSPPGTGVPPHVHSLEDEIVIVTGGIFEIFLDGSVSTAGPGAILNFVRGKYHGFRSVGDQMGTTIWITTPGLNFQTFLRTLSTFPPGPPDVLLLDQLHAKHGITMPPPSQTWW
jgi:quercetin dioxygenase-like cupin family protein